MKLSIRVVLILGILLAGGTAWALHPFYEQNGDCYLLVGEGAKRGVYALNNLSSGTPNLLYNPYDAYGLTASQKWDPIANKSIKELFTFAGTETGLASLSGMVARRVMTQASSSVYDIYTVPPFTVHRFHGASNQGPTGRGNHPLGTINSLFAGTDYPCSIVPTNVATMPGYQWVPLGKFYHARDVIVWSNWTYAERNRNPGGGTFNPQTYGTPQWPTFLPPGPWDVCCNGNRPQNGFMRGGWVRRLIRENLNGKFRNLKLYKYTVGSGLSVPAYQRDVATVLTQVTGTLDKNGECCDGCISRIDGENQPGVPSPLLDCVYSSNVDRSYIYRRDFGLPSYLLQGTAGSDMTIGNGGDLTCEFLGVSSRNTTGNFVYLLGKNQINQWLTNANAPPGMLLDEVTDVAVSDQWWQTGGIVYAYDKPQDLVYQFKRNEGGSDTIPISIPVLDVTTGLKPDKIGADGFGNLYLMRTLFDPATTTPMMGNNTSNAYSYAYSYSYLTTIGGGIVVYRARFRQNVYKGITKRDYYSGLQTEVPGKVLLGMNEFFRDFTSVTPAVGTTWLWMGPLGQYSPAIDSEIRTELGVINTTTPPRVENEVAVVDCNGPLVEGSVIEKDYAYPTSPLLDADGFLPDSRDYIFLVENFPSIENDGKDINTKSSPKNNDGDGASGVFPSTTKRNPTYHWKVLQVKDRNGFPMNPASVILDQETNNQVGGAFYFFQPSPGEFRVGVKAKYQYYNYNNLPLGQLSDKKETVLTGLTTATGGDADGYSWETIKIKPVPFIPPASGTAVLMSGRPLSTGGYKFRPDIPDDALTTFCLPSVEVPPSPDFVLNGTGTVPIEAGSYVSGDWAFRVRETYYNIATGINRIASITAATPPDPMDPKMIRSPMTLQWLDPAPQFTWKSTLLRGPEIIWESTVTRTDTDLGIDDLRKLFPVPSQPASYSLSVNSTRRYAWDTYVERRDPISGTRYWDPKTERRSISLFASATVCVTDPWGPKDFFANPYLGGNASSPAIFVDTDVLYGTTGETLRNVDSPPSGYSAPNYLEFIVADDNPMGNDTTTGNSGRDRFHGSISSLNLKITHIAANRVASFSYSTTPGMMPPASFNSGEEYLADWYQTGAGPAFKVFQVDINNETEFNAAAKVTTKPENAGKYCKSFSYRKLYISLDDVKHFSRPLPDEPLPTTLPNPLPLSGEMDTGYANSNDFYNNLSYGFAWRESSGNVTDPQHLGQIVIRDNDRPNAFIQCSHDKSPEAIFTALSNINSLPPKWVRYSTRQKQEPARNGPESFTGTADFKPSFHSFYLTDPSAVVQNSFFNALSPLEIDIPTQFRALISDNIGGAGGVATVSFFLASGTDVLVNNQNPIQYIFPVPGKYTVKLSIRDNAKGWPSNPKGASARVAGPNYNYRNIEGIVDVVGFKLDVRVIDRTRLGR